MVLFTSLLVAGTGAGTATLAGVTTALEVVRNRGVLELVGLQNEQHSFQLPCDRIRCRVWTTKWHPCHVGFHGDVLLVSGRRAAGEEALILSGAKVSETETFVNLVIKAAEPLRLRFDSSEEASAFAEKVRSAAMLKQDMSELADIVSERKRMLLASMSAPLLRPQESRSSIGSTRHSCGSTRSSCGGERPMVRDVGVGCSLPPASSKRSMQSNMSAGSLGLRSRLPLEDTREVHDDDFDGRQQRDSVHGLRRELSVPLGVPVFALSPNPSGKDLTFQEVTRDSLGQTSFSARPSDAHAPREVPRQVGLRTSEDTDASLLESTSQEESDILSPASSQETSQDDNRVQVPRTRLAVPNGVPMFQLSPDPSGASLTLKADRASQSQPLCSASRKPNQGARSSQHLEVPDMQSGPRALKRWNSETDVSSPQTSPRDPNSFASKVLTGLGLAPAKADLQADTRVDVLKSRFEEACGRKAADAEGQPATGRSMSQPISTWRRCHELNQVEASPNRLSY
eukprot:TRINITY_DN43081_c0_g1_i1.p1 TRINITY_DN43081_c0_g1~~TRINITY_DN43081_c0_g1_i1.p1  ORF type:complete len:525 (-),score=86.83 TRINITY_DN43081_c0_g1_i1:59-1597(-)